MTTKPGERGSATVLVLALSTALALVGIVLAALGGVAVARHRAASAADLAALAAADRALLGRTAACTAAERAAVAVEARLDLCHFIEADVAEVVVSVRPPGRLGSLGQARSIARAGPRRTGSEAGRNPEGSPCVAEGKRQTCREHRYAFRGGSQ